MVSTCMHRGSDEPSMKATHQILSTSSRRGWTKSCTILRSSCSSAPWSGRRKWRANHAGTHRRAWRSARLGAPGCCLRSTPAVYWCSPVAALHALAAWRSAVSLRNASPLLVKALSSSSRSERPQHLTRALTRALSRGGGVPTAPSWAPTEHVWRREIRSPRAEPPPAALGVRQHGCCSWRTSALIHSPRAAASMMSQSLSSSSPPPPPPPPLPLSPTVCLVPLEAFTFTFTSTPLVPLEAGTGVVAVSSAVSSTWSAPRQSSGGPWRTWCASVVLSTSSRLPSTAYSRRGTALSSSRSSAKPRRATAASSAASDVDDDGKGALATAPVASASRDLVQIARVASSVATKGRTRTAEGRRVATCTSTALASSSTQRAAAHDAPRCSHTSTGAVPGASAPAPRSRCNRRLTSRSAF